MEKKTVLLGKKLKLLIYGIVEELREMCLW